MKKKFIRAIAKHLPPSASTLHLLDVGGVCAHELSQLRADLKAVTASLFIPHWQYPTASVDAIVAYDVLLSPDFLRAARHVLRAGGRLVVVNPLDSVNESHVGQLEEAGFVRILVEPALPLNNGGLYRGEKAHTAQDTHERIQQIAQRDADGPSSEVVHSHYLYLLIKQSPNKPVWKLEPGETRSWDAVAIQDSGSAFLLAFSSLPKAVSFMQPAVLQGFIVGINKLGKFTATAARAWPLPFLLNPTLESVQSNSIKLIAIDPETAEAPDE